MRQGSFPSTSLAASEDEVTITEWGRGATGMHVIEKLCAAATRMRAVGK
jgi:hypothetical protein